MMIRLASKCATAAVMAAYQQSKIIIRHDNTDGVDRIVWDVPPGGPSQVAIKRAIVNNIVAVIIILL